MSVTIPTQRTAGPLALTLVLDDEGAVSGESPTVRVRLPLTANDYLDFADWTFKTSGWTTKEAPMTESTDGGSYYATLDPSLFTNLPATVEHLAVEYTNGGAAIPGFAFDLVSLTSGGMLTAAEVWQYVISGDIGIADSAAEKLWAAALVDIDLGPVATAIDILLRRLSQVGVNVRAQVVAPSYYATHRGDSLEVVVYQNGEPIDQAVLDGADELWMRVESIETGARVEVVALAPGLSTLSYTLADADGVLETPGRYKVQGYARLVTGAEDVRWSEQRIYVANDPIAAP